MKVTVGISNRHIHLTKKDFRILFGNIKLDNYRNLSQPGEFASNMKVNIEVNNKIIENVRVVGPFRKYTQVELLQSDAKYLEINPPIRESGDLKDANIVTVIVGNNKIVRKCAIIAERHIHLNYKDLKNIHKKEIVILTKDGQKIDHIKIKRGKNYVTEIHLDKDDGYSYNISNGDQVEIIDL